MVGQNDADSPYVCDPWATWREPSVRGPGQYEGKDDLIDWSKACRKKAKASFVKFLFRCTLTWNAAPHTTNGHNGAIRDLLELALLDEHFPWPKGGVGIVPIRKYIRQIECNPAVPKNLEHAIRAYRAGQKIC